MFPQKTKSTHKEALGISGAMLSTAQRPLNLAERKECASLTGAALWDEGGTRESGWLFTRSQMDLGLFTHMMSVSLHAMQLRKSETITPAHCREKAVERKQRWELGIWDLRLAEAIPLKGH